MDLAVEAYAVSGMFPREEMYCLTSQLRRAAISIPANIAEGHGRLYRGEYIRSLSVSRGSLSELDTHAELALRLGYVTGLDLNRLRDLQGHVGRMLSRLLSQLRAGKPDDYNP